jgi:hypothetical protein
MKNEQTIPTVQPSVELLEQGEKLVGEAVRDFRAWRTAHAGARGGSRDETVLEALALGVLWNVYGDRNATGGNTTGAVTGLFATVFFRLTRDHKGPLLERVVRLVDDMEKNGDHEAAIRRIRPWLLFLGETRRKFQEIYLAGIIEFGAWFSSRNSGSQLSLIDRQAVESTLGAKVLSKISKSESKTGTELVE